MPCPFVNMMHFARKWLKYVKNARRRSAVVQSVCNSDCDFIAVRANTPYVTSRLQTSLLIDVYPRKK